MSESHQETRDEAPQGALISLCRALLELRPALGAGVRVPSPDVDGVRARLVAAATAGLSLPPLCGSAEVSSTLRSAVNRLSAAANAPALFDAAAWPAVAVSRTVRGVRADSIAGWRAEPDVRTPDGVAIRSYRCGVVRARAVVLASACGMPAELCEPWMRALAPDHDVVTWETRGLFGPRGPASVFDSLAVDPEAQADDLIAVLDHCGIARAHVIGLCGGAVVAIAAAGRHPDRVSTLSLWHGDYELGPGCLKSEHQHQLKALMQLAYESRESATMINGALRSITLSGVGDRVAATVCYPYLDDEIFYRYCALTGAIMSADVASLLPKVRQPTLVVTSQDDHTAHPAGSIEVARRLPRARLHVEPHGDHLSVFAATPRLRQIQQRFLAEVPNEVSV